MSAEQTATLAEQYDLGDGAPEPAGAAPETPPPGAEGRAEITPARPAPSSDAEAEADAGAEPADAGRPRNADGTFAPRPQHARQTLRLAADLGIPADEVAATAPDVLDERVYQLTRALQEEARRQRLESAASRGAPPGNEPARPPAPETQTTPEELEVSEADFDPKLVAVLRRQAAELKALRDQVGEVKGFQQQRVQESIQASCDRAFARHETVLGKGRGQDLRPDDPHYLRRKRVLGLVDQLPATGTLADRVDRAVEILFGVKPAAAAVAADAPSASGGREQEWRQGGLARPTHRGAAGRDERPDGKAKATDSVTALLREMQQDQAPSAEDEFPG